MHLDIVSFNVPWPADYGGVIDVFCRLKALVEAGVRVHLHCYTYGREKSKELAELCEEVCYYPRETGLRHQLERRPYIVASRNSERLIERLRQDDYPILLEGLHDCFVLERLADGRRKIVVRAHNVEHDYYRALAHAEKHLWKKLFFLAESRKLEHYEPVLTKATCVLPISEKDAQHFVAIGCPQVMVLPPSHGHSRVVSPLGRGEYVLYQGNLSVPENIRAVEYIVRNLVSVTEYQFVVAGRDPGADLRHLLERYDNVTLVANPSEERMNGLLAGAQVNILVTDQATGVKLKLMNALYESRFCLVNGKMVEGTGLGEACVVADTPEQMLQSLERLMTAEFTEDERRRREEVLVKGDSLEDLKNILF